MPWKGVTVSEQRANFLRDYALKYYNVSELAEMYSISRKTAYKWIYRHEELGRSGLEDLSRRPPPGEPRYSAGYSLRTINWSFRDRAKVNTPSGNMMFSSHRDGRKR